MSGRGRAHRPDPDWVDAVVSILLVSPAFDASLLSELTADAVLANRTRMKMLLSRHGRVDFDSWRDKDVGEMQVALEELVELIRREGAAAAGA